MAMRRMVNQYETLMQNGDVQGLRNNRSSMVGKSNPGNDQVFVDDAMITQVNETAGGTVFFRGRSAVIRQVSDEPLQAGQVVLISRTLGGEFVVHGSKKGS